MNMNNIDSNAPIYTLSHDITAIIYLTLPFEARKLLSESCKFFRKIFQNIYPQQIARGLANRVTLDRFKQSALNKTTFTIHPDAVVSPDGYVYSTLIMEYKSGTVDQGAQRFNLEETQGLLTSENLPSGNIHLLKPATTNENATPQLYLRPQQNYSAALTVVNPEGQLEAWSLEGDAPSLYTTLQSPRHIGSSAPSFDKDLLITHNDNMPDAIYFKGGEQGYPLDHNPLTHGLKQLISLNPNTFATLYLSLAGGAMQTSLLSIYRLDNGKLTHTQLQLDKNKITHLAVCKEKLIAGTNAGNIWMFDQNGTVTQKFKVDAIGSSTIKDFIVVNGKLVVTYFSEDGHHGSFLQRLFFVQKIFACTMWDLAAEGGSKLLFNHKFEISQQIFSKMKTLTPTLRQISDVAILLLAPPEPKSISKWSVKVIAALNPNGKSPTDLVLKTVTVDLPNHVTDASKILLIATQQGNIALVDKERSEDQGNKIELHEFKPAASRGYPES